MDPLVPIVAGPSAAFVALALVLGRGPGRDEFRHRGPDYEAMAEIETHDIEQMLDGINERRRRTARRELAEELADDAMRDTWKEE